MTKMIVKIGTTGLLRPASGSAVELHVQLAWCNALAAAIVAAAASAAFGEQAGANAHPTDLYSSNSSAACGSTVFEFTNRDRLHMLTASRSGSPCRS